MTAWSFTVEDACIIIGRGVAVFGGLTGELMPGSTGSAVLEAATGPARNVTYTVELALKRPGVEQIALLVRGIDDPADVPRGAVLRPSDP